MTGDDFGLSVAVNEATEEAHRHGILTAASLMVGAPAVADAVARARRLPDLKVGLHVVVVRGRPVLPPEAIPDLVDADGHLRTDLARAGVAFFFRPAVRRQLEAEIRAQFEAFRRTGLTLDHVDGHNHMQVHPTVLALILKVGRGFGLRAVRVPFEPAWLSWRACGGGLAGRLAAAVVIGPWARLMKARLGRAGVVSNDYLFGVADSGAMTAQRVMRYLAHLPRGVSEIYFHPGHAGSDDFDPARKGHESAAELEALTSGAVKAALRASGIECVAFGDLTVRGA